MDKRLEDWIFPETLNSGCFGKDATLVKFVIDEHVDNTGDQFASEVIFVRLHVKLNNEDVKIFDVIIKVQLSNPEFRNLVNSTIQFQNEIFMYETILPMFDQKITEELFCKYYHGYVDPNDPTKDFIVLGDLRNQGYRLSKDKVFLDYEHCAISMKELGRFHALTYLQKARDAKKLLSSAEKLQDKWTLEALTISQYMIESCAKRGIQPLIDRGESIELLESLLHEYEDVPTFFRKVVKPTEPDAVICHGDFNRNNLLFQYDENQCVTGVKLIDLQMPRYSSPSVDLSFFICMNMSHSLRTEHLNDLLDVYKQSLLSTVSNNTIVPELDLSRAAIFGYIISSFFLPIMMAERLTTEEVLSQGPNAGLTFASKRGGQKETEVITDVIKDLIKFGFIKKNYD